MIPAILGGAATAAAVSLLCLAVVLPWLRRLAVIDVPVERSMHTRPVVRGGGLALLPGIVGGAAATLLAANTQNEVTVSAVLYVVVALAAVLGFAALGLSDDFFVHGVLGRLLVQIAIGVLTTLAVLLAAGHGWIWALPAGVGLVAVVNVTNFMDGANGLLALHGLVLTVWFGALAVSAGMAGTAGLAAAAAGALLAFLPVNLRGRAFLGDVGSYALGALWGVLGLLLFLAGLPVECVLAPAMVFFADFSYTLQLRIRAGGRWYQPHRLHVYQRLITAGWSHLASAALTAGLTAVCCLLSLPALLGAPLALRAVAVVVALVLVVGYLRLPARIGAPSPWHGHRGTSPRGEVPA